MNMEGIKSSFIKHFGKGGDKSAVGFFAELPPWARGVLVVGGGIVVVLIGGKLYHLVFPSQKDKQDKALYNSIKSEIQQNSRSGQQASYPSSQYDTFANSIYDDLYGIVGNNYGNVVTIMERMNNNLDVALLIQAFGLRQLRVFGLPSGAPIDLFSFVNHKLGSEYFGLSSYKITEINDNWSKKGIKYRI